MRPPAPLRAAIAGVVHGVAEWLPVSSSGHVALLIDAAGWPEAAAERRRERRALEVALHTGSLLPLGARLRADLRASTAPARLAAVGVAATGVTAVLGAAVGPLIERRLAGPRSVAFGLAAGSVALLAAERAAPARPPRAAGSLGAADAVLLGVAQTAALWPGVSRRAATLAAARLRGFDAANASALSWSAGVPTLVAATAWQFTRARDELRAVPAPPAAGAAASAVAGTLSRRLPDATAAWSARRWAVWRLTLAAATLLRR